MKIVWWNSTPMLPILVYAIIWCGDFGDWFKLTFLKSNLILLHLLWAGLVNIFVCVMNAWLWKFWKNLPFNSMIFYSYYYTYYLAEYYYILLLFISCQLCISAKCILLLFIIMTTIIRNRYKFDIFWDLLDYKVNFIPRTTIGWKLIVLTYLHIMGSKLK